MDAKNDDDILLSMPRSHAIESQNVRQSCSDSQPVPANQLDQLIKSLTAQAQAQTALTQALDYLIGQNQQLIELVIQHNQIDNEKPVLGDSLD